jgi:hypothetical protein
MAPALAQDMLDFSGGALGTPKDKFHQLVDDLSRILGPSSGLDSADTDVKHLEELMSSYISKESEWQKYAFSDLSRGYTRNLVDEGNGKSNLVRYILSFVLRATTSFCTNIAIIFTNSFGPHSSSSSGHPAKAPQSTTTPTPTAS